MQAVDMQADSQEVHHKVEVVDNDQPVVYLLLYSGEADNSPVAEHSDSGLGEEHSELHSLEGHSADSILEEHHSGEGADSILEGHSGEVDSILEEDHSGEGAETLVQDKSYLQSLMMIQTTS